MRSTGGRQTNHQVRERKGIRSRDKQIFLEVSERFTADTQRHVTE